MKSKMKTLTTFFAFLEILILMTTATTQTANAVVYCQYVKYPVGCVARAGVVLRPRPMARAAVRHNAGGNANGGVNRVGVRR